MKCGMRKAIKKCREDAELESCRDCSFYECPVPCMEMVRVELVKMGKIKEEE